MHAHALTKLAACYSHKLPAEWERRRTMAPPSSSDWSGNNDNDKATMECFYAAVRNADKACLGWSYDGDNTVAARPIRLLGHGNISLNSHSSSSTALKLMNTLV
jgi:hypothetical protein